MIAQRNYNYFFTAKCDCCKRVRKVKSKIEIIDDEQGLCGELTLCPTCLKAFNMQQNNDDTATAEVQDFDEESMDIEDFRKLGYEVQVL